METSTRPSSRRVKGEAETVPSGIGTSDQDPGSTTEKVHGLEPQTAVDPAGVEIVKPWGPNGASAATATCTDENPAAPETLTPLPLNATVAPKRLLPFKVTTLEVPLKPP